MPLVTIDPLADSRWRTLVEQRESSVFHSPAWLRVLADSYGFDPQAFLILNEHGEPTAGLPFVRINDLLGERIVSLPFSDYCDPLVGQAHAWTCLSEGLLAERCPVSLRCVHNDLPLGDPRFPLVKRAKWHGVDLRPELDTLWQGLHESSRRAIRKAQRDGVTVSVTREADAMRAFFEMHLQVRKYKYRLLSQPYRFFESIWRQMFEEQRGLLLLASYQGTVIGGILFLEWQDRFYYKFNASLNADLPHRPNDLLTWTGIEYAREQGYTQLDFGLSDWDQEGLVRYKRKFAGEEKTISFLRADPSPSEDQSRMRGLLSELTDLFTDAAVPDRVTEKAGDTLYRLFV